MSTLQRCVIGKDLGGKCMSKYKYYPMHMHIHASCDRGASMALDMYNASLLNMNYIWFTDHDTRICKRDIKGIRK